MAIKKTQLSSSLWNSCDEFHGSMDGSQYKDYVLVLLLGTSKGITDQVGRQGDWQSDCDAGAGAITFEKKGFELSGAIRWKL